MIQIFDKRNKTTDESMFLCPLGQGQVRWQLACLTFADGAKCRLSLKRQYRCLTEEHFLCDKQFYTLSIHYIQMEQNYGKNAYWTSFCVCTNGYMYIFNFFCLQLLLFCEEILLEKYPVRQLTVPSCSVVEQNFPNINIIVNYHILIIHN